MVEQLHSLDAKLGGGGGQLGVSQLTQGAVARAQRGCLAVREAEHGNMGSALGEAREEPAEPEALVVGVGAHGEHGGGSGQTTRAGTGGHHHPARRRSGR